MHNRNSLVLKYQPVITRTELFFFCLQRTVMANLQLKCIFEKHIYIWCLGSWLLEQECLWGWEGSVYTSISMHMPYEGGSRVITNKWLENLSSLHTLPAFSGHTPTCTASPVLSWVPTPTTGSLSYPPLGGGGGGIHSLSAEQPGGGRKLHLEQESDDQTCWSHISPQTRTRLSSRSSRRMLIVGVTQKGLRPAERKASFPSWERDARACRTWRCTWGEQSYLTHAGVGSACVKCMLNMFLPEKQRHTDK